MFIKMETILIIVKHGLPDQDHHCMALLSHRHGVCPRKFLVAAAAAPVPPLPLVPTLLESGRGQRRSSATAAQWHTLASSRQCRQQHGRLDVVPYARSSSLKAVAAAVRWKQQQRAGGGAPVSLRQAVALRTLPHPHLLSLAILSLQTKL